MGRYGGIKVKSRPVKGVLGEHLFYPRRGANYFADKDKNFLESSKVREQKKETEIFAAYFLIPKDKLNQALNEEWLKESPDLTAEIVEEFQVSRDLIRKRFEFKKLCE